MRFVNRFVKAVITISYLLFAAVELSSSRSITVFPSGDDFYIFTVADSLEFYGRSGASYSYDDDGNLQFRYVLRSGVEFPYAGIGFSFADPSPHPGIGDDHYLELSIESSNAQHLVVYADVVVSSLSGDTLHAPLQAVVELDSGAGDYRVPLSGLAPPDWWLDDHGFIRGGRTYPEISFKNIRSVGFKNFIRDELDQERRFTISSVRLAPSYQNFWAVSSIYLVLLLISLIRSQMVAKRRELVSVMDIPRKSVELTNVEDSDLERLLCFIANNYMDPEISIQVVSKQTGLNKGKIPELLQRHCSLMFKQYVNKLRVEEAQRLLLETDRQITEIAIAVGYNYPSSFNRIFKEMTGTSPNIFRQKSRAR